MGCRVNLLSCGSRKIFKRVFLFPGEYAAYGVAYTFAQTVCRRLTGVYFFIDGLCFFIISGSPQIIGEGVSQCVENNLLCRKILAFRSAYNGRHVFSIQLFDSGRGDVKKVSECYEMHG